MTSEPSTNSKESSIPFLVALLGLCYFFDIPTSSLLFCLGYPLYLYVANTLRFDGNRPAIQSNKIVPFLLAEACPKASKNFIVKYIPFFALVGVVLPLIYVAAVEHYADDMTSKQIGRVAVPHLFVLLAQIVCEHTAGFLQVHEYIKCLVSIGFSIFRQGLLYEWLGDAYEILSVHGPTWTSCVGLLLSATNMIMWTYNTFGFLMLRMMPVYLDGTRFPVAPVKWKYGLIPICSKE